MVEPYFAQEPDAGLTPPPSAQAPTEAAQALQRAGGEMDLLSYRMQMARRMTVMSQAETAALQGLDGLDEKYRHDTDYATMEDRYKQDAAQLQGNVLTAAKQQGLDPMSLAELQARVTRYGLGYQKQIFNTAWSGQASTTVASLDQQASALQNRYWAAGSDAERAAISADYQRNVNDAASAGWIAPEAAQARVRLFDDGAQRGQAMQLIAADPQGAKAALADPARFSALTPETRAALAAHATAAGDEQGLLQVQLMGRASPAAAAAAVGRVSDPGVAEEIYRRGVAPDQVSGDASAARAYLASLSAHPDRPGDTANLHPDFALRLAGAVQEARSAGLPVTVQSAYRADDVTGNAYDAAGLSLHGKGAAADVGGIGAAGSAQARQWAEIAQRHGLFNPYGVNDAGEFNHWQLVPWTLDKRPDVQAGIAAAGGDMAKVWNAVAPVSGAAPGRVGEFKAALGQLDGSVPAAIAELSAGPDKAKAWLGATTAKYGQNFTPDQFLSVVDDPKAHDAVASAYQRLAAPTQGFGLSPDGALRAQLHLDSEDKAYDEAQRRTLDQLASLQRANDPVTDNLMSGYAVDPTRLADYRAGQMAAAAQGSAEAAREARRVDFAVQAAPMMKAMMQTAPSQLEALVTQEQSRLAASPDVTQADRDRLETMTRALAGVKAGAASNPVGLAVRAGLTPAPTPIPVGQVDDPVFAQAMRERDDVAKRASAQYGAPLIPLQPDEAQGLKTLWSQGTPASKADLAARIAGNCSPEVAEAAMRQIGGDDPLDLAAGRIAVRDPALGQKVLEGAALLKEPGVKPKVDDVRAALGATLGGELYPSPTAQAQAIDAGLAVYAADRAGNGALFSPTDRDGLREAITKVTGPIVSINGRQTPITPGLAPAAVTRVMGALAADDLKPFGGLQADLDPAFVGSHAQLIPKELGGSLYAVQIGGRPVFTADARPLVVDLKQMAARGQAQGDADQGAYAEIFRKGPGKYLWGSTIEPPAADDPLRSYGWMR
jgi:hypothetical protein